MIITDDYIDGCARQMFDTVGINLNAKRLNALIVALKLPLERQETAA